MPIGVGVKGIIAIAGLALLLTAAPAQAATRYGSPSGTAGQPCNNNSSEAAMCPIDTAVNASSGDDVVLVPGAYTTFGLSIPPGVTVHGTPGASTTITGILSNANGIVVLNDGSILRDVRVEVAAGQTNVSAVASFGGTMERVYAYAQGSSARDGCQLQTLGGTPPTVIDSVCLSDGTNRFGVLAATAGAAGSINLRNVTAIGRGGGAGIEALSNGFTLTVNASNTIADGPTDAVVRNDAAPGTETSHPVALNFDHSNYATVSDSGDLGVTITTPGAGTNVTTAPIFFNAASGDFRQVSTSAGTIDRGTATGLAIGELDLDGQARNQGSAPDIGASS